jgi:hypothetical protein
MKSNEEILADQRAFMEAYARADEFFRTFDGVTGVGYGQKNTSGEYLSDLAIIVYVREKKPDEALSPEQQIPKQFEGYRTDVVVVRPTETLACVNETQYDVIRGGIQIAPKMNGNTISKGTLACIVHKRNDSGQDNVYLLSCLHVLFDVGAGINDMIWHPLPEKLALGRVMAGYYQNFHDSVEAAAGTLHADFFVDCGVARVNVANVKDAIVDSSADPETDIELTDVRNLFGDLNAVGTPVFKVGRTTRRTAGIVRAVGHQSAPAFIPPDGEPVPPQARNVISIDLDTSVQATNCNGEIAFAAGGDSGSLVFDAQNRAVGLIAFRDVIVQNKSTAYACCIVPVLDRLEMSIGTTTGTSHGATLAADGTGRQPVPSALDTARFPPGKIAFTAGTAEPLTDTEQQHMRALLEQLRTTRRGRELHDLFGIHRREAGYLIRNHKLIKATWHRNQGPAFLAHVLNHLKGHADGVPREVNGVDATTLLTRMAELLMRYGSNPLRDVIRAHYDEGLRILSTHDFRSIEDCLAYFARQEAAA